jgi:ribosomal protein L37AE/L43A
MDTDFERQCDRCREFKPAEFSFMTENLWICQDCKIKIARPSQRAKTEMIAEQAGNKQIDLDDCQNITEIIAVLIKHDKGNF